MLASIRLNHIVREGYNPLLQKTTDLSLSSSISYYWLSKVDIQARTLTNVPTNSTDFRWTQLVMQNCAWYASATYVPQLERGKCKNLNKQYWMQGQNYLYEKLFLIGYSWKRLTKPQFSRFVLGKVQQFRVRSCRNQFTSRYCAEISVLRIGSLRNKVLLAICI